MPEQQTQNGKELMVNEQHFRSFLLEEDGVGVVEVILILVVLIALVIIFRDQIVSLVHTIWKSINDDAQDLM